MKPIHLIPQLIFLTVLFAEPTIKSTPWYLLYPETGVPDSNSNQFYYGYICHFLAAYDPTSRLNDAGAFIHKPYTFNSDGENFSISIHGGRSPQGPRLFLLLKYVSKGHKSPTNIFVYWSSKSNQIEFVKEVHRGEVVPVLEEIGNGLLQRISKHISDASGFYDF
jgi:hypothetical protein